MYRYKECGLPNIRLANGYTVRNTPYGKSVSIADVEGLHRAIGKALVAKPALTGAELRFLRKELDWSQRMLATFLGVTEQSVSLWERKGNIPPAAERLTRLLYIEHVKGDVKVRESVEALAQLDRENGDAPMEFEQRAHQWREAA